MRLASSACRARDQFLLFSPQNGFIVHTIPAFVHASPDKVSIVNMAITAIIRLYRLCVSMSWHKDQILQCTMYVHVQLLLATRHVNQNDRKTADVVAHLSITAMGKHNTGRNPRQRLSPPCKLTAQGFPPEALDIFPS